MSCCTGKDSSNTTASGGASLHPFNQGAQTRCRCCMCKAMASEGTSSSMGKGNVSGQPQQREAPAPPSTSIPGGAPPSQSLGVFGQPQPETSAHPLTTAGIANTQQLSEPGAHMTTLVPRPQQPFRVMPSSTSSVSSGQSLAAGLQEAMQQMQLQPSSSTPAPAGTGSSGQPPGQMRPRALQDSSDLAHLLGQAQQQAQQQEQAGEDGPATVCASLAWLCRAG